ncbi:hypothetical protein B0H16DRAFT_1729030 [Mycena metata]|uniref:Ribonuclease H1 N-terminal domain-containing protein n=1 Tax=Mycena metata TaxID=1033252 RepID=A0AAD7N0J5_9AGAR|nr:hypothetical protein B0H16DRAFT_1729030 [Mycena metata]
MPNGMRKINMTVQEMVPDTQTVGHDPRFWCLPPIREDLDDVVAIGGGYEFHLVVHGRKVGVWKNWTVAQAMISGYPDAAHKGHHTLESCVAEWQAHCQLGVHPHPVEPTATNTTSTQQAAAAAGPSTSAHRPRRSLSVPQSRRSSGRVSCVTRGEGPARIRYFALWGTGVVYSSRYTAKRAFDAAVEGGQEPELLTTDDFDVAVSYAEGDFF